MWSRRSFHFLSLSLFLPLNKIIGWGLREKELPLNAFRYCPVSSSLICIIIFLLSVGWKADWVSQHLIQLVRLNITSAAFLCLNVCLLNHFRLITESHTNNINKVLLAWTGSQSCQTHTQWYIMDLLLVYDTWIKNMNEWFSAYGRDAAKSSHDYLPKTSHVCFVIWYSIINVYANTISRLKWVKDGSRGKNKL